MLIVPASKVSVPLTVVMRTRSKVPDSVFDPLVMLENSVAEPPNKPEADQVFPVMLQKIIFPLNKQAAVELLKLNPAVNVAPAIDETPARLPPPLYPVISIPPESPIWAKKLDVPDKDTPSNITVIRFTYEGMLKKSKPTTVIVVDETVCDALTV